MIPKIKSVKPENNYRLSIVFDDGKEVLYDVSEDIETIKSYADLKYIPGLFQQVQLDQSRTCVYWNEDIDLASDTLYEYGREKVGALYGR